MDDFKYLSEEELANLSAKERRDYLKQKKEYENQKMVKDVLNESVENTPLTQINEVLESLVKEPMTETITPAIIEVTKVSANTPVKKSNAGRKKISDLEKKQQIMLTIEPESKHKLEAVDSKNFKKLLGRYIDKNIDVIVEAIEKL